MKCVLFDLFLYLYVNMIVFFFWRSAFAIVFWKFSLLRSDIHTRKNLEGIMLLKQVRERQINTIWFYLFVEAEEQYKWTKHKQIHRCWVQTDGCQREVQLGDWVKRMKGETIHFHLIILICPYFLFNTKERAVGGLGKKDSFIMQSIIL